MAQVFSCDFCETFKNTFFVEHTPVVALEICIRPKKVKLLAMSNDI